MKCNYKLREFLNWKIVTILDFSLTAKKMFKYSRRGTIRELTILLVDVLSLTISSSSKNTKYTVLPPMISISASTKIWIIHWWEDSAFLITSFSWGFVEKILPMKDSFVLALLDISTSFHSLKSCLYLIKRIKKPWKKNKRRSESTLQINSTTTSLSTKLFKIN